MNINGYILDQWQRCKRPYLISRTHRLSKWWPSSLLGACLRHAIFNLSRGELAETVASTACSNFLAAARNPGLDISGVNPYVLAMDYCAIIRNVIEFLSRLTLLTLTEIPPTPLTSSQIWQFLSLRDEAGTLHRWKFVDYIPKDFREELHSWEVFGDMAVADAPMTLHLVGIGQIHKGHQNSPWCKIYSHPSLANIYRFQKVTGDGLKGDWKPVWFQDNSKFTQKEWVDKMIQENVLQNLVQHIPVKELSDKQRNLFFRDYPKEANEMEAAVLSGAGPRDVAMSRYACDHPYICPHQFFCYNPNLNIALDDVGIYTKRAKEAKREHIEVG